jgi:hypothetical protein
MDQGGVGTVINGQRNRENRSNRRAFQRLLNEHRFNAAGARDRAPSDSTALTVIAGGTAEADTLQVTRLRNGG